jgi:hypothetical protein
MDRNHSGPEETFRRLAIQRLHQPEVRQGRATQEHRIPSICLREEPASRWPLLCQRERRKPMCLRGNMRQSLRTSVTLRRAINVTLMMVYYHVYVYRLAVPRLFLQVGGGSNPNHKIMIRICLNK